jgi:tetraacyldisaccharide 4'-kinase
LKTPQFWNKINFISCLLLPISWLYLLGHFLNCLRKTPTKINKPIICIGNLVAGGAGKTPVAIEIGKILQELNIGFSYLSAGYGAQIQDFTLVDKSKHNSKDVGDEPILLSDVAPTFISKDRVIAATLIAKKPEIKLIIMDDGLQNPSIIKDLSILIIDGYYGFGNDLIIPAGPLREPIKFGMKKADLVVIIGEDRHQIAETFCANKIIIRAKIVPVGCESFDKKSAIAFCGIGRPEKFFISLQESGVNIITKFSYADHHQYQEREIRKMINLAKQNNVSLITTKKDWIRFDEVYQRQIKYMDIKVEFENIDVLRDKLIELANG